jgi:hypothetical protein
MAQRFRFTLCFIVGLAVFGQIDLHAQSTSTDWAWKILLRDKGLEFAYLFYSKADNHNNGIVLKLTNRNGYPVTYRFKMVLRSDDREVEIPVSGELDAKTIITGEEAGLFFVPFKDGTELREVGLRAYRVEPVTN